jgi:hypothetical protein
MGNKSDLQPISDLFNRKTVKPPAFEWQDLALRIIKDLGIPNDKRNAVFRVCKQKSKQYIEKCFNDTKELCASGEKWRYFFKIVGGKNSTKIKI